MICLTSCNLLDVVNSSLIVLEEANLIESLEPTESQVSLISTFPGLRTLFLNKLNGINSITHACQLPKFVEGGIHYKSTSLKHMHL